MDKKILIITAYFPPYGGGGVYRVLKFAKYLPEFGWKPYIVTGDYGDNIPFYDESLLKDLPESIEVFRIKSVKQKLLGRNNNNKSSDHNNLNINNGSLFKTFYRVINGLIEKTFIPDKFIIWCYDSLKICKKIIEENNIDIVMTTSPPNSIHLLGQALKKKYSTIKWITDFRDLWTVDNIELDKHMVVKYRINRLLEKNVLSQSDLSLVVGDKIREATLKSFDFLNETKIKTVTNGFDPEDFNDIELEASNNKKFTFTFTGSMFRHTKKHRLLEALKKISTEDGIGKDIKVKFVGLFDNDFKERVDSHDLNGMVEFKDFCSHKESVRYMMNSDALILTLGNNKTHSLAYTLKFFQYMNARKPILAVAPEGCIAELVNEYNLGAVVNPNSEDEIVTGIKTIYNNHKNGRTSIEVPQKILDRFNRFNLTEQLSLYLEELASS